MIDILTAKIHRPPHLLLGCDVQARIAFPNTQCTPFDADVGIEGLGDMKRCTKG
jgi:hypothetical protein